MSKKINEVEKFINKCKINKSYYEKTINNEYFNVLNQKIKTAEYKEVDNIFWLSMLLYRISFLSYFQSINCKYTNKNILKKENIVLFFPFVTFSSEICKIVKEEYIYTSQLSTIGRQIIEQICVVKEIEKENIEETRIIDALIQSHNKHVGAGKLNFENINDSNPGILKVFKNDSKYGKLAKKYGYQFIYNLFSGDIHHLSTINKLIPNYINNNSDYNKAYLLTYLGLIKEAIMFVDKYSKVLDKDEIKKLQEYDFVKIN